MFILALLAISLLINVPLFLLAYKWQSDKLTDGSYAVSFIALALVALLASHLVTVSTLILAAMICIWGLRIGSHLVFRVITVGKDRRFDGMREDFVSFGKFWVGQGLVAWLVVLPAALAIKRSAPWHNTMIVGFLMWLIGLLIETAADFQKISFHNNASNKGHWIDSGLWRYSRHPNYFGEILVWSGTYAYAFVTLTGTERLIGLLSPVLIAGILLFGTGIPILEKSADKRWGKLAAYQQYKARTSILILLPPTKKK